ncbi:MAG: class I SAM-dependent methyltransferase, partial [Anaerolineae bacterium]|nr:class I SAM-dependent methyltransferase [Anaerolineae bacterium]
ERPVLVVDLGCGTGLATRLWAGRADAVIGIEPSEDMLCVAQARTDAPHIRYRPGYGHDTGLPDGCADIVVASQAFHWMEPVTTLAEVGRILRTGGVFAAFDAAWPITVHPAAEQAELDFMARAREIEAAMQRAPDAPARARQWRKSEHLERMRASGQFTYVKEIALHTVEAGDADRFIGLTLSQGHVQTLLKNGSSEAELGLPAYRAEVRRILGERAWPWYVTYWLRFGIR